MRHRDSMRRAGLALAPRRLLDAREGMHVGVVQSRVECGNFRRLRQRPIVLTERGLPRRSERTNRQYLAYR